MHSLVTGCSLAVALRPGAVVQPVTALRSTVHADPVLNEDSLGACLNGNLAMQGYVTVVPRSSASVDFSKANRRRRVVGDVA